MKPGGERMDWKQHDLLEKALFEEKSLTALMALIEAGRELEFKHLDTKGFISCDGAEKTVSLWINGKEQSFDSMQALIGQAVLPEGTFASLFHEIEIETLF